MLVFQSNCLELQDESKFHDVSVNSFMTSGGFDLSCSFFRRSTGSDLWDKQGFAGGSITGFLHENPNKNKINNC